MSNLIKLKQIKGGTELQTGLTQAQTDIDALEALVGKESTDTEEATGIFQQIEELEAAIGTGGAVSSQIDAKIALLDVEDTAVAGEYVSAVSEVDGKVVVSREKLTVYADKAATEEHIADTVSHVTAGDKTAWNGAVADVATLKGTGEGSVAKAISDAVSAHETAADAKYATQTALESEATTARAAEEALGGRIDTLDGKVTTLVGEDANKSVRAIAAEEIAAKLVTADAAEALDTLEEIAAWIQSHPGDAATMNEAITALQNQLKDIPAGEGTVKKYVDDAIAALKIGDYAKAADLTTLAGRVKANEDAITELKNAVGTGGSVDTKIADAIAALDVTDTAVAGEYVSAVNEVDGKVVVSREKLTVYADKAATEAHIDNGDLHVTAEKKSAWDTAATKAAANETAIGVLNGGADTAGSVSNKISNAINALDLANTYAAKTHGHVIGDVEGLQTALDAKATSEALTGHTGNADIHVTAAQKSSWTTGAEKAGANETAIAAMKEGASIVTFKGVEEALAGKQAAGDYATKAEAQGYANAKDTAIAAAQKAGDDAQAAADKAQGDVDALAGKVGSVPENKTVVQMISDANTYADGAASAAAATAESNAKSYADGKVNALDATKTAAAGKYISGITQVDGLITEIAETALPVAAEYSIVKAADSGDYAAVYNLTKDGTIVGASINIPKDMVVKSGSVDANGNIVLVLNDEANTEITINAASLIEYVTSGSVAGDMVVVNVSDDHKVTATITDGTITAAKLTTELQTAIGKAHSHDNATVLNGITAEKVAAWDAAEGNAKAYADQAEADAIAAVQSNGADTKDSATVAGAKLFATDVATAKADAALEAAKSDATSKANAAQAAAEATASADATAKANAAQAAAEATASADATAKANAAQAAALAADEKVKVNAVASSVVTSNTAENITITLAPTSGYAVVAGYAKVTVNSAVYYAPVSAGATYVTISTGFTLELSGADADEIYVEFCEKKAA